MENYTKKSQNVLYRIFCYFFTATSMTAPRIKMIPAIRRVVSVSPKTVTPMATAVTGSKAPKIAVGVEPIIFTAFTIKISESTVGTKPSIKPQPHELACVKIGGNPEPSVTE